MHDISSRDHCSTRAISALAQRRLFVVETIAAASPIASTRGNILARSRADPRRARDVKAVGHRAAASGGDCRSSRIARRSRDIHKPLCSNKLRRHATTDRITDCRTMVTHNPRHISIDRHTAVPLCTMRMPTREELSRNISRHAPRGRCCDNHETHNARFTTASMHAEHRDDAVIEFR